MDGVALARSDDEVGQVEEVFEEDGMVCETVQEVFHEVFVIGFRQELAHEVLVYLGGIDAFQNSDEIV